MTSVAVEKPQMPSMINLRMNQRFAFRQAAVFFLAFKSGGRGGHTTANLRRAGHLRDELDKSFKRYKSNHLFERLGNTQYTVYEKDRKKNVDTKTLTP